MLEEYVITPDVFMSDAYLPPKSDPDVLAHRIGGTSRSASAMSHLCCMDTPGPKGKRR